MSGAVHCSMSVLAGLAGCSGGHTVRMFVCLRHMSAKRDVHALVFCAMCVLPGVAGCITCENMLQTAHRFARGFRSDLARACMSFTSAVY